RPWDMLVKEFEALKTGELANGLKEKAHLHATIRQLESEIEKIRPFRALHLEPGLLQNQRVFFTYFEPGKRFDGNALKGIAHEKTTVHDGDAAYVLLAADAKAEEKVKKALEGAHAVFDIPKTDVPFSEAWENLEVRKQNAESMAQGVQKRIQWFIHHKGRRMADLLASVEIAAKKAELPSRFGESRTLAVAEGWVPEHRYAALEAALEKRLGKSVVLEKVPTRETPPTRMKNPRPIKPFEFLVQALSLPRYGEIDPTILVFLSFPFFFGMILGDIGYGLAMLGLAFIMRQRFPEGFFRSISGMMILSGIWTMVFGFIFGEFLGAESVLGYELHPYIHRISTEGIDALMQLSLLFGFLHLSVGFAIGAYVNAREKHGKHAIAKASWLAMLVSLLGFLSLSAGISALNVFQTYARFLPAEMWLGLVGLSLLTLLLTEGGNALLELPSLVGNLVSYLRIMALGIVGAVLALMVNTIPLQPTLDPAGFVAFVLFTAFFILGQVFALALGIFESAIQSLRLHYVEFFSKFYHGGGSPFVALREKKE
ncbi:MAG: V-type ATPase 116kDa subunit family protein, partial [Candidatus Micrarchaeota archaeon]|nr:V-type ATPase 116kDa subunit family protein [Candidatus Micrarchaeota archaeon]